MTAHVATAEVDMEVRVGVHHAPHPVQVLGGAADVRADEGGAGRTGHHRLQRGWTQENEAEELAALAPTLGEKHLPVTGRMVGKWERGEATPKGVYRRGLCLLFGATAEELGLYQPPEKGIEDMQRRAFLQGLGVLTGFAVASSFTYEPWERLSAALAQPRRLDDTAMRDLEAVTASLESQYATVAPVTLTGAVQDADVQQ